VREVITPTWQAAVAATVGAAGRDAGQRDAGGFAHGAEGAVLGQQAFHAVEDGLAQRHIDHVAQAAALALVLCERLSASTVFWL